MSDREAVRSIAAAIRMHADVLEGFASDPSTDDYTLERETIGRANLIEGRLFRLRSAARARDTSGDDIPRAKATKPLSVAEWATKPPEDDAGGPDAA